MCRMKEASMAGARGHKAQGETHRGEPCSGVLFYSSRAVMISSEE